MTGLQVDYEGGYPIEGAKEVSTLMTRYVSRALRDAVASISREAGHAIQSPTAAFRLSRDGMGLEAVILHDYARPERPVV